jgi:hypothetical protein
MDVSLELVLSDWKAFLSPGTWYISGKAFHMNRKR